MDQNEDQKINKNNLNSMPNLINKNPNINLNLTYHKS